MQPPGSCPFSGVRHIWDSVQLVDNCQAPKHNTICKQVCHYWSCCRLSFWSCRQILHSKCRLDVLVICFAKTSASIITSLYENISSFETPRIWTMFGVQWSQIWKVRSFSATPVLMRYEWVCCKSDLFYNFKFYNSVYHMSEWLCGRTSRKEYGQVCVNHRRLFLATAKKTMPYVAPPPERGRPTCGSTTSWTTKVGQRILARRSARDYLKSPSHPICTFYWVFCRLPCLAGQLIGRTTNW